MAYPASTRLIEYVAVAKPDGRFFRSTGTGDAPSLLDPASEIGGEITYRVPAIDNARIAFPGAAASFVFPSNAKILSAAPPEPYAFHSFVSNSAVGDLLYCFCFTRFVQLSPERLSVVKMQEAKRLMDLEDEYAIALAELKNFRFLDSLADLLWRTLDSPAPLPLGRSIVHVRAALHDVQLQYPASADQPPLADINFRVLFRLLEPKVIIEIFNAMLCEVSVLLLADSVDELTPCLEALNALLHPMKWPFVYVPVLPLSLVELFDAPQAFFFGSLTSLIGGRELPDQIMVVDLDKNRIVSSPAFEPLPWHLSWRLWESIVQNMGYYQHYCPTASLNVPANLPLHAALLADDTGGDATHASSPTSSFSSLFSSVAADTAAAPSTTPATSHRTSITAHVASHVAPHPSLPLVQSEQSRQLPRRLSYVRARSAMVPSVSEAPPGVPSWLVHRNSGSHSSLLRIENATVSMLGRGGQQSGLGASAPGAPPRAHSAALPDSASAASSALSSSTVNAHDAGAIPLPKRPSLFSAALEQFLAPRRASLLTLRSANDMYSGSDDDDDEKTSNISSSGDVQVSENGGGDLITSAAAASRLWVDPVAFDPYRCASQMPRNSASPSLAAEAAPQPVRRVPDAISASASAISVPASKSSGTSLAVEAGSLLSVPMPSNGKSPATMNLSHLRILSPPTGYASNSSREAMPPTSNAPVSLNNEQLPPSSTSEPSPPHSLDAAVNQSAPSVTVSSTHPTSEFVPPAGDIPFFAPVVIHRGAEPSTTRILADRYSFDRSDGASSPLFSIAGSPRKSSAIPRALLAIDSVEVSAASSLSSSLALPLPASSVVDEHDSLVPSSASTPKTSVQSQKTTASSHRSSGSAISVVRQHRLASVDSPLHPLGLLGSPAATVLPAANREVEIANVATTLASAISSDARVDQVDVARVIEQGGAAAGEANEMSAVKSGLVAAAAREAEAIRSVMGMIRSVIISGVPLFNAGNAVACKKLYLDGVICAIARIQAATDASESSSSLTAASETLPERTEVDAVLEQALEILKSTMARQSAKRAVSSDAAAFSLRHAMDALLALERILSEMAASLANSLNCGASSADVVAADVARRSSQDINRSHVDSRQVCSENFKIAALRRVIAWFKYAINRGAPEYNLGRHGECLRIYSEAIDEAILVLDASAAGVRVPLADTADDQRRVHSLAPSSTVANQAAVEPSPLLELLWQALHRAYRQDAPTGAWTLRRAMDEILALESVLQSSLVSAPALPPSPCVSRSKTGAGSYDFGAIGGNEGRCGSSDESGGAATTVLACNSADLVVQLGGSNDGEIDEDSDLDEDWRAYRNRKLKAPRASSGSLDRDAAATSSPFSHSPNSTPHTTDPLIASASWPYSFASVSEPSANVSAVRGAFMSVFVSLLRGYREFIRAPTATNLSPLSSASSAAATDGSRGGITHGQFSPDNNISLRRTSHKAKRLQLAPVPYGTVLAAPGLTFNEQGSIGAVAGSSPKEKCLDENAATLTGNLAAALANAASSGDEAVVQADASAQSNLMLDTAADDSSNIESASISAAPAKIAGKASSASESRGSTVYAKSIEFDDDGFLASVEPDYRGFLRGFIQSQMFRSFLDARAAAALALPSASDWFDSRVLVKMKSMSQRLRFFARRFKTGLMWKEGSVVRNWNQRWFLLDGSATTVAPALLEYYKPHDELDSRLTALRRNVRRVTRLRATLRAALTAAAQAAVSSWGVASSSSSSLSSAGIGGRFSPVKSTAPSAAEAAPAGGAATDESGGGSATAANGASSASAPVSAAVAPESAALHATEDGRRVIAALLNAAQTTLRDALPVDCLCIGHYHQMRMLQLGSAGFFVAPPSSSSASSSMSPSSAASSSASSSLPSGAATSAPDDADSALLASYDVIGIAGDFLLSPPPSALPDQRGAVSAPPLPSASSALSGSHHPANHKHNVRDAYSTDCAGDAGGGAGTKSPSFFASMLHSIQTAVGSVADSLRLGSSKLTPAAALLLAHAQAASRLPSLPPPLLALEAARGALAAAIVALGETHTAWRELSAAQFRGCLELHTSGVRSSDAAAGSGASGGANGGGLSAGDNIVHSRLQIPDAAFKTEFAFEIVTPARTLLVCADDDEQRRQWLRVIGAQLRAPHEARLRRFVQSHYMKTLLAAPALAASGTGASAGSGLNSSS